MMKYARAALAAVGILLAASCAGLITGGPLIREGEPVGAIEIYNGSSATLNAVLISDCNASTYGLNRLPEGVVIPPGRSYQFRVSAGCWDVMPGWGTATAYANATGRIQVAPGRVTRYGVRD